MSLRIRQEFPLGRYHATPWRQSVFEDRRGEWPPSPWRLLRALAARWFQYSREVGEQEPAIMESLLRSLASELPRFHLATAGERGPGIRQYQPTGEFAWSDPKKGSGAIKKSKTTLVPDQYQVAGTEAVFWIWEALELSAGEAELLRVLLRRTLYFGRAESHCRLWVVDEAPAANCEPCEAGAAGQRAPVLAADWHGPLRLDSLLAETDSDLLRNAPVPPGAAWVHYRLALEDRRPAAGLRRQVPSDSRYVQFAVGGRLYPPAERWIKVTERFRGKTLTTYTDLCAELGPQYALLAGKDPESGKPNDDHSHAYFVLWPDENGDPTRLIVWRRAAPFVREEMAALSIASEFELDWGDYSSDRNETAGADSRSQRRLRLVQLPEATKLPWAFSGTSRIWESVSPFVPPASRHRFRRNGKIRAAELPEAICARLVEDLVGQRPIVEPLSEAPVWTKLHEPLARRAARKAEGETMSLTRPGYRLRLRFDEPVTGPLLVGDSAHFGLGAFRAVLE
ncbi:type I-U CRISPR-associated protein Csb2 [uncultured Paludibaculum sp.]|uniref:type I-G CRISPR-associated protein Csb2 n=1 Tax=uncultured Paludibaculum sp. TaxID=1765020 RepID=UPI002AAB3F3C|nr:type I-U CRISPR-associated protein Csb2 [uncultured Paludibaculum sp.]